MKLTVLGSGTSVPHPKRASSGYFVEANGGTILIDCSGSIATRMAAAGLNWPELDAVWISHFHLDHVGGLPAFLAGTKHAAEMRDRSRPLQIVGPVGLKGLIERFDAVRDYKLLKQPFPVEIIEVEPQEPFEIGGMIAVALKTPHTPESLAIHVRDSDETTLVYSADTGFTLELAAFARLCDLFILECSFPADKPAEKHLDLAEAMYIIRKAKPKRAMLTHFYPEWDKVDLQEEVARFDPPCEVVEATDGLVV
ncbi:MAG: ribonuclease Z [Acidobacteria bacterium]|nr:ribonuclease Z [Acidobacteriota bacterium]